MPVLSYQVNAPGYGGVNPKIAYIFTDDSIAIVTAPNYIDWLANQQGIYTGDVALVVTRETPTSTLGAGFYEFVRIGMTNHWNLVPQSGSGSTVNSVTGTLNQIIASPTTGNVIVSIDPDPQLPGTGSVGLPKGTTAQQAGIVGSIRFNTQTQVFEGTADGSTWVPFATGGSGGVTSLAGTANQIVVSAATGNVTVSIDPDPILPGTAAVTLPAGNTGARGNIAGSLRYNTQTSVIELTNDGSNWYTILDTNNGVSSVSGTANRITVTGTNMAVVDISASYVGQTSITTLGTIATGTWNASTITVPFGGTGNTTFTPYSLITANTTGTGALQPLASLGTSGQVLTSNGAGAYPTWQASGGGGGDGEAKFWLYANGAGTSILGSFNVTSITDGGPGNMTVTIATDFANVNWCATLTISAGAVADNFYRVATPQLGSLLVLNIRSAGSAIDPGSWFVAGFGDQ